MGKKKDLTGQRFGRLVVIEEDDGYYTPNGRHVCAWICKCDCGNVKSISTMSLLHSNTQSCGCIKKEILAERNKKENTFIDYIDYYVGQDSNGNIFKFDSEDFDLVSKYCWSVNSNGYVVSHPKHDAKAIRLHRLVMGIEDTSYPLVDHINNDPTDCRKCNLRLASHTMNHMNVGERITNSSGVTGVAWHKASQKWRARITVNGKELYLGIYDSFEEAVKVRREAEDRFFGDFSYTRSQKLSKEYDASCEEERMYA